MVLRSLILLIFQATASQQFLLKRSKNDILAQQEANDAAAADPADELGGMTAEDLHRVLSEDSDSTRRATALRIIEGRRTH